MKFVPVPGTQVLFSIWDTRVQDFEAFVADTNYDATGGMWSLGRVGCLIIADDRIGDALIKAGESIGRALLGGLVGMLGNRGWKQRGATWREPGFTQGTTHPVVGVSWNDAKKFCERLTGEEQGSGMLPRGQVYRLPTDAAWSVGVGLQGEEGNNPKEKNYKIKLYPWGKEWPPPKGAGNYAGEESKIGKEPSDWPVIKRYNDDYPRTSPVGSFAANANGLHDMGGNVWQWCEDWFEPPQQVFGVLRGASWAECDRVYLLASYRNRDTPDNRNDTFGFRCVVGAESSR